ncbi:hypothetical protein GCM10009559_46320 [Pseudonocardia zijingensis]|jgi:hypothetical protein|uniref:Uncharacterized protein n=1 Tax=Pseudonocardia zijingensis TaxID=153376 RepID=A0ABN1QU23_9PSEU
MNKRVRRLVSAAVGVLLSASALSVAAPAAEAATNPVRSFRITYGNTYTTGTVTFYNQSVLVQGEHKSVSPTDCRFTRAKTWDYIELHQTRWTENVCDRSAKYSMTLKATNKGGAAWVEVQLVVGEPGYGGRVLAETNVYRN